MHCMAEDLGKRIVLYLDRISVNILIDAPVLLRVRCNYAGKLGKDMQDLSLTSYHSVCIYNCL